MIDSVYYFLGGAYIVGTVFGIWVGRRDGIECATIEVVDMLIARGFLKTKGDPKDPEILKYDSAD